MPISEEVLTEALRKAFPITHLVSSDRLSSRGLGYALYAVIFIANRGPIEWMWTELCGAHCQ